MLTDLFCFLFVVAVATILATTPVHAQEDGTTDIRQQLLRAPRDSTLLSTLKATIQAMPPGTERTRLAVIYAFGAFLSDEPEEARTVAAYLKQNGPGDGDLDYLGPAYTHDLCTRCDGDGYIMVPCDRCEAGRCQQCAGSGRRIMPGLDGKRGKCIICNGTGKCPECEGVGQKKQRCPTCNGGGTVPSREMIRKTYESLLALDSSGVMLAAPVRDVDTREVLSFLNTLSARCLDAGSDEERETRFAEAQSEASTFLGNARASLHALVREIRYDPQGFAVVKVGAFDELVLADARCAIFFGAKDTFLLKMPARDAAQIREGAPFVISGRALFSTKPPQAVTPEPGVEPVVTAYLSGTTRRLGTVTLHHCAFSIGSKSYEPGVREP